MNLVAQVAQTSGRVRKTYYGWWLVGLTGFIMTLATVPLYHAMAVWSVALESQFGWSRAQLGFALTFTRIEGGLMGPVEGYLTDRLGTRRMVLIGLLILGLGFLIFWQVDSLWMFYLAFIVMAVGQRLGSWLPLMTGINNWFVRRQATAMGWANVGSRLGALLLVPAIAWSVDPQQERLGWQLTALILGIVILALAVPISRAIRNRPQDYGQLPDGDMPVVVQRVENPGRSDTRNEATAPSSPDLTASQAIRTPAFWLIALGHGFTSMVILAIMAHLGLLLKDKGFDVQTTGWIVTAYTAAAMGFQLIGGYLGDRAPKNLVLFVFSSIQAAGVVLLTFSSSLAMFFLFAILFGMGFGGRNPLTTAIRGEYFGRASFGRILGLSTVPMNVLLLVASPFAGFMRDIQGTYTVA
ncbi:MAG TPA: MFS transporter, partial [Dehalococcoidia bacterium]|nr:MFS transporter [Dehalococcoidia bacterium]